MMLICQMSLNEYSVSWKFLHPTFHMKQMWNTLNQAAFLIFLESIFHSPDVISAVTKSAISGHISFLPILRNTFFMFAALWCFVFLKFGKVDSLECLEFKISSIAIQANICFLLLKLFAFFWEKPYILNAGVDGLQNPQTILQYVRN